MEPMYYWFIFGLALLILELFTLDFSLASLGTGAIAGGVATWLGFELWPQIGFFTAGSLIVFFSIRPIFIKYINKTNHKRATGIEALVGQNAQVTEKIQNHANQGRVQIGGENWRARSTTEEDIEKNLTVTVEKIEGATAYVKKFS